MGLMLHEQDLFNISEAFCNCGASSSHCIYVHAAFLAVLHMYSENWVSFEYHTIGLDAGIFCFLVVSRLWAYVPASYT